MKRNIHILYASRKKGYILSYILVLFCLVVSLVIQQNIRDYHRASSVSNLKEIYAYFLDETLVIQHIKTLLLEEELVSNEYQIGDVTYALEVFEDHLFIDIIEPHHQQIIVYLNPEKESIIDYEVLPHE